MRVTFLRVPVNAYIPPCQVMKKAAALFLRLDDSALAPFAAMPLDAKRRDSPLAGACRPSPFWFIVGACHAGTAPT